MTAEVGSCAQPCAPAQPRRCNRRVARGWCAKRLCRRTCIESRVADREIFAAHRHRLRCTDCPCSWRCPLVDNRDWIIALQFPLNNRRASALSLTASMLRGARWIFHSSLATAAHG